MSTDGLPELPYADRLKALNLYSDLIKCRKIFHIIIVKFPHVTCSLFLLSLLLRYAGQPKKGKLWVPGCYIGLMGENIADLLGALSRSWEHG